MAAAECRRIAMERVHDGRPFQDIRGKTEDPLQRLSRRSFLAAGAALLAGPRIAFGQAASPLGSVDVVIVGAGAAGVAAARRLLAAGRTCVVLEAADRIGGRCRTDREAFGIAYDRGARLLYQPAVNPVALLGPGAGHTLVPVQTGYRLRVGTRFAREGEMERHLAMLVRARRAIEAAARRDDPAAGAVLPRNVAEWRPTLDFVLGTYRNGTGLDSVSARDLARSSDRDRAVAVREGCGALIETLANGLPVRLSTPATRISITRGVTAVDTPEGRLLARAVIVTASTAVLASGRIAFDPALPAEHRQALASLPLGHCERVALELPGNPLRLPADALVLEHGGSRATAALRANIGGSPLALVDVPGGFGRDLARRGDAALAGFAVDWLGGLFGADIKRGVRRTQVTRWSADPFALGAFSVAAPGAQEARQALAMPVHGRVYFAGEATHETMWGTVGGAWASGEAAADAVTDLLDGRITGSIDATPRNTTPRREAQPQLPARRRRRAPPQQR